MNPSQTGALSRWPASFPLAWMAVFTFLMVTRASVGPSSVTLFLALAVSSGAYLAWKMPGRLWPLLQTYCFIFLALLAFAICIVGSEASAWKGRPEDFLVSLPAQVGVVFCVPALVLFLQNRQLLRLLIGVFLTISVWHFVAMPIEAVFGLKTGWHPAALVPRAAGPLVYQASGLAADSFFFSGLFQGMFYMAVGVVYTRRLFGQKVTISSTALLLLTALWLIPVACVQSRSAFAGSLAALLLTVLSQVHDKKRLLQILIPTLLVGGLLYAYLFSGGKSGLDLRTLYLKHYFLSALQWPGILMGKGFVRADYSMVIPGTTPVGHSHNDLVQILFSWGLPALLAYMAFWAGLVHLIYQQFVKKAEYWPVYALVAALPAMVTDLGFQLFEKAAFIIFLTALCMALATVQRQGNLQHEKIQGNTPVAL